jgi:hypothetical protein
VGVCVGVSVFVGVTAGVVEGVGVFVGVGVCVSVDVCVGVGATRQSPSLVQVVPKLVVPMTAILPEHEPSVDVYPTILEDVPPKIQTVILSPGFPA